MRIQIAIFIFILVAIIGIAGFYITPSRREVALMRLEDRNFNDAFVYYKQQSLRGEKSINILAPLIKIYIYYGYPDKAISLLESYVGDNPESIEGRKQLTALYKSSQYYFKYCESLEALQKLAPSTDNLQELANTYGFLGKYQNEMETLSVLVKSRLYHPVEEDYVRLASLYMVDHKHNKEAIQTLIDFFNKGTKDISISTAHMAVQLLAENNEEKKALSISKAFLKTLKKDKREENAIVLSGVLHRKGKLDQSYAILEPYLFNVDNSPDLLQRVVEIKLSLKRDEDVYNDLSKRFEKGTLPDLLEVALLDLAIQFNNNKLIEAVLKKASLTKMAEDSLVRFVDKAAEMKRPDLAALIRNKLGKDYLSAAPLLSAVIEIAEFDTPESLNKLINLPKNLTSMPEQKMILVSIFLRHNRPEHAYSMIDGMSIADIFHVIDSVQFAEIYLAMSDVDSGQKRLNSQRAGATPEVQAKIDDTKILLHAGTGNIAAIQKWLKDTKDIKLTLYADGYGIASHYKKFPVALLFAERVYKLDPKPQNQIELSEALMLNNRYDDALKLLQPLADHDAIARSIYLNGMSDWIRNAGITAEGANRAKIDLFLATILKRNDLTMDEKRDLAYLLAETGFTAKAEDIFIEVAGNQDFHSHDVSELLGFWGDTLSPKAVEWVTRKASSTSAIEQALWLSYANDTGNPKIVIAAMGNSVKGWPAPVADEYINALIAIRDYDKLAEMINHELENETSATRLLRLSTLANQESLPAVAEKGWRKVYAVDPNNSTAQRELGMLAFSLNHYAEAQTYLEQYIKEHTSEYKVNYVYGELLLRKGQTKKAAMHFELAQVELSALKEKELDDYITEASLLYRTNKVQESFTLYNQLVEKHPDNKSLRADYIQALIDNKQFKEASLLLSN